MKKTSFLAMRVLGSGISQVYSASPMNEVSSEPEWRTVWQDHSFPEEYTTEGLRGMRFRLYSFMALNPSNEVRNRPILGTIDAINIELSERNNAASYKGSTLLAKVAIGISFAGIGLSIWSSLAWESKQIPLLEEIRDVLGKEEVAIGSPPLWLHTSNTRLLLSHKRNLVLPTRELPYVDHL